MFLAKAIPHQHRQEVSHAGKSRMEVSHTTHDVGFTKTAIPDREGEECAAVEQSRRHGEVLPLSQGTSRGEKSGNLTGQVTQKPVLFPEAIAQLLYCRNPHIL